MKPGSAGRPQHFPGALPFSTKGLEFYFYFSDNLPSFLLVFGGHWESATYTRPTPRLRMQSFPWSAGIPAVTYLLFLRAG